MDRGGSGSGRRGGYNSGGGNNSGGGRYYQHSRREFHASQRSNSIPNNSGVDSNNNPNFMFSPVQGSVSMWRNLIKRHQDLNYERSKCIKEMDFRPLGPEKIVSRVNPKENEVNEGGAKNKESNEGVMKKEKSKPRDTKSKANNNNKLKKEESLSARVQEQSKFSETILEQNDFLPLSENNFAGRSGENKKLENESVSKSTGLELEANSQKRNNNEEVPKNSPEAQRAAFLDKFTARERKLDQELQRFYQEMERQLIELERRVSFDPVLTRNKILERELMQRDQTVQHLQHYIADLEERNRATIEEMQQMSAEFNFEKMQMRQEFEHEQEMLVQKVKLEAVTEFLQGYRWINNDPSSHYFSTPGANLDGFNNSPNIERHKFQSPCLQPLRSPDSNGILTDLRDRYEDIKVKVGFMHNDKVNSMMTAIRKIVLFYEAQGMRVYEESMSNKYISTLMWCPNELLYPNKFESSLAVGHGDTVEEATENAAQLALYYLQGTDEHETETNVVEGNAFEENCDEFSSKVPYTSREFSDSFIFSSTLQNSLSKERIEKSKIKETQLSESESCEAGQAELNQRFSTSDSTSEIEKF